MRDSFFSLSCIFACSLLVPIVAFLGLMLLLAVVASSALFDLFLGARERSLDQSQAREMAHRMCTGCL